MLQSVRRNAVANVVAWGVVVFAVRVAGVSQSQAALISHWALDNGAPSQIVSDSVGVNSGTLGATAAIGSDDPTWFAGSAVGTSALDFDGGDYALVPYHSSLDVTSGMTISAWAQRDNALGRPREIFLGKGNGGGGGATNFWLDFQTGDTVGYYLHSGGDRYLIAGAPAVTDTNWHHIVGTYDGSVQRLYLDGVQIASQSFAGTISVNTQPFAIGKLGAYGGELLDGKLDDVGLWGNALSGAEVKALFNLAQTSGLLYDLGQANLLFELHNAQAGTAFINGQGWGYTSGLNGGLGVVQQIGSQYFLQLDISGSGVFTLAAPEPATFWMLGLGLLALRKKQRCQRTLR